MKKNDKLVVVLGVIILIIASIGIYYWDYEEGIEFTAKAEDFFSVSGNISAIPESITVSDSCPFYPLIATPLAVHYDTDCEQEIIPLYVKNYDEPSRAVERVKEQIFMRIDELIIDDSKTAKEASLELAQTYWESSDGVLLIEYNETGYNLGVLATPLASYMSIPVIVTDEVDSEVKGVLGDLGVKTSLVCGNLEGYGNSLRFESAEDVVNCSIEYVMEKFGEINYLTIANPVDAWPPEVLDSEHYSFGPKKTNSAPTTMFIHSKIGSTGEIVLGSFKIPKDYKYALVKIEGTNLKLDGVNDLGDSVTFKSALKSDEDINPQELNELFAGKTLITKHGYPDRDPNGNIINDRAYTETVLYDRGGMEYQITAKSAHLTQKNGEAMVEVTIEKLNDSVYPMMSRLSSIAPYLTAYRKGMIFGKPEFAFTANDDTLANGEPSPGYYMPRLNPELVPASNKHVFKIHEQINMVLAKLAYIDLERDYDIKNLQKHYENNPIYIALVGGATVIPQIYYEGVTTPMDPESISAGWGPGVPSDFIYGNIDPKIDDWSNQALDLYSPTAPYPFQENIVGRITGNDVQDACALILRTVFYDEIINKMGEWKDKAAIMYGGGTEFQQPLIRYKIYGEILGRTSHGEPMKLATGASYFFGLGIKNHLLEPLGFDTEFIEENEAIYQGFSNEAIAKLKKANLLNLFIMSPRQLRNEIGTDVVKGRELIENSNFIFITGHGSPSSLGLGDVGTNMLGWGLPNGIFSMLLKNHFIPVNTFGQGPGFSLAGHGMYVVRNAENLNIGPSVIFIESCGVGKIDGVYPERNPVQAFLQAGCNAMVTATTFSNIPGGYLEPKNTLYDLPGQTLIRYIKAYRNMKQGIYPEEHFGEKIYAGICEEFKKEESMTTGLAFRESRNRYLPEDADWELWWSPPLISDGDGGVTYSTTSQTSGFGPYMDHKYITFFEFILYGDPAFHPYIPK